MDKILVIFKREYLERVRARWFIISTLLVPALIAVVTIVPAYFEKTSQASASLGNIAVLDATGTDLGARITASLTADSSAAAADSGSIGARSSSAQLRVVAAGALGAAEATATAEVMRPHALTGFLVLTDSTLSAGVARYAGRDASSIGNLQHLESVVRHDVMMVRLQQAGVRPELIGSLSKASIDLRSERLDNTGRSGSAQSGIVIGFGIAFLLYISIIMHGQNVMRGVMEEKLTRVAEAVLSSVKPDVLLAGKVLGVGAVGLTQQLLWVALSVHMINFLAPMLGSTAAPAAHAAAHAAAQTPAASVNVVQAVTMAISIPTAAGILAFFLAGFILYASLYAAIGAMVSSEQEAQQAALPMIFLLVGTFAFVNLVAYAPDGTAAQILSWIPFASPIIMPMRMVLHPQRWPIVAGSLLVAFAGCAVAVWVAARIYRVGMLMYGKRPSVAELLKWVRYA